MSFYSNIFYSFDIDSTVDQIDSKGKSKSNFFSFDDDAVGSKGRTIIEHESIKRIMQ